MDTQQKLGLLGGDAVFDLSCACGTTPPRTRGIDGRWIYPAALPDGKTVNMLKVLLTNSCQNDCAYCAQRAGRDTERGRFEPEELARLFDQLVKAGMVQAIFLSSGLGGNAVRTMDRMLSTTEIIRSRYGFRGFVHLKVLPGAELAQVQRAAQLAQRISINLEAPGEKRLLPLSGSKNFQSDILQRMWWIARLVADPNTLARGHTTQFVVGASDETDSEIVGAAERLYQDYRLSRAYYSGFQPVPDTPLENHPPTSFVREHRLYQADFLLRKYGFSKEEIPFEPNGNLSLQLDPKTAWAKLHPERFPVDVNRADREELLRVPGLGPGSVARILQARKEGRIKELSEMKKIGAGFRKAAPFILLNGRSAESQLGLF